MQPSMDPQVKANFVKKKKISPQGLSKHKQNRRGYKNSAPYSHAFVRSVLSSQNNFLLLLLPKG